MLVLGAPLLLEHRIELSAGDIHGDQRVSEGLDRKELAVGDLPGCSPRAAGGVEDVAPDSAGFMKAATAPNSVVAASWESAIRLPMGDSTSVGVARLRSAVALPTTRVARGAENCDSGAMRSVWA